VTADARQTFTLGRGWYYWSFRVHQAGEGLHAVCITADGSFAARCAYFGQPQG